MRTNRRNTAARAILLALALGEITTPLAHAQTAPLSPIAATGPRLTLTSEQRGANGSALFFFSPGTVSVRIGVDNMRSAATIRWTAQDFDGRTVGQGTLTIDPAQPTMAKITANRPGIVYVSTVLVDSGGGEIARADTRFAILKPTPISAESVTLAAPLPILYGACAHLGGKSPADAEREVALMSALGFRGCRFDYNWNAVQPARDTWDWTTFDRIFGLMEKYRMTPLPIVAYTAKWATTGDPNAKDWHAWHNAPPVAADYARFAGESARRYGKSTPYWEIWNEPDIAFWLGTPEEYAAVFDAAAAAIHAANPKAQVMNGGFSETRRRPEFIPTWMKTAKTKPDIFAYHSHNAFGNMLRASNDVKTYLTPNRWTMPVWLNEAGYSSLGKQTERDQAIALVKKMSSAAYLGFSGYFLYDIRNDGTDLSENEHNFGLVRQDFTPKASAVAVHTLLESLRGQRFVRRVPVPGMPQAWALLFEQPDTRAGTLVLWHETAATVPLLWRVPAKATRLSLMGEVSPLAASSGLISLPLTPEPQFLRFQGSAAQIQVAGRLLQFPSPITAGPGDVTPFPVRVQNPLNTPLRGTLTLTLGGGWKAEPSALPVDIPANGSKDFRVSVKASALSRVASEMQMAFTSANLPSAISAQIPLLPALIVSRQSEAGTLGDFTARKAPVKTLGRTDVVSLFEATPMRELQFHGDEDLSAKIYLSRPPQGLSVAVRVRDDVFTQNEAAGMEWKGDSVQFALSLPTGENYEGVLALTKNGPVAYLTIAPKGVATGRLLSVPLSIRRDGVETLYDVVLPAELPGGIKLPDRFRFSLLVNDNDGAGRKGWVEWTPGIGRTKDPSLFASLIVR